MNAPLDAGQRASLEAALKSVTLDDKYTLERGRAYMSGIQALVRLPMLQQERDRAAGLNTAGFISGYRGSPLGGLDLSLWKAKQHLAAHQIVFQPGLNEDLAATAVWGSQQVNLYPGAKHDGVFGMWYGKGPGVDRTGDVFKHANSAGSSKHGGVLVLAGDDHAAKSSTLAHQSEHIFKACGLPVLFPSNVQEYLDFGLHGWAMSRYSGLWVALKCVTDVVESSASVDIDPHRTEIVLPTDFILPEGGLNIRWPDPPLVQEARLLDYKWYAALAYVRANKLDRIEIDSPSARFGIMTGGKAYLDVRQALTDLGLDDETCARIGIRLYKVGCVWPLEAQGAQAFARGLDEILVVEEKRQILEYAIKEELYNWPDGQRPRVFGKFDEKDGAGGEWSVPMGNWLLPAHYELSPAIIAKAIATRLEKFELPSDVRARIAARLAVINAKEMALAKPHVQTERKPWFCSGCPHNTSTKVPEGSIAQAGIGCHFMASWMERDTTGLIQMGGEGVDWAAHAMFTNTKHVFQNLGDGTYFHSGILAIRQAVAAKANITYKILYNDAVAMTGGQPVDGSISVPQIARQVEAEGVSRFVVVSDEPEKYDGHHGQFPPGTTFHHRSELDTVQRELRETPGVTVLIYDQTCAAEKRRRRKKGEFPDPDKRLFINDAVCEGCGDCGVQSNCLSVEPLETPLGRKRRIDQSSCNKDYSCVNGFCPSFVTVEGAALKKAAGAAFDEAALAARVDALPVPATHLDAAPFDMLVTGVGGTGVVTVGALISMAAHLEGKSASVLDFMGFAQKGGSVLSFVRIASSDRWLNQVRIDTQQADVLLACDMVVGASAEALQTVRHERSRIVVNTHRIPNASFVQNPDANLHADALLEKMRHAAGDGYLSSCDAQALAAKFLGDSIGANILMLGYAWQLGLVPVSLAAMMRAIELNNVAVPMNKLAFSIGRMAAGDAAGLDALWNARHTVAAHAAPETLAELIADREARLDAYGGARYVERYRALVSAARAKGDDALTRAVATTFYRLLAVKDEYEVARLYTDDAFRTALEAQFEGVPGQAYRVKFNLAPPTVAKAGRDGSAPKKRVFGQWMWPVFGMLARVRSLRGTWLDPFGRTVERRMERALADDYETTLARALAATTASNAAQVTQLADLHARVRGFGHVKVRNLAGVKRAERELALQLGIEAATSAAVQHALDEMKGAGMLKGIPVVVAK